MLKYLAPFHDYICMHVCSLDQKYIHAMTIATFIHCLGDLFTCAHPFLFAVGLLELTCKVSIMTSSVQ